MMAGREGDGAFIFVSKGIADADRIGKKGRTEGGKGRPSKSASDRPTQNFGFVMLKRGELCGKKLIPFAGNASNVACMHNQAKSD